MQAEWESNLATLQAGGTQNSHQQAARQVLNKSRPCEKWMDYIPDLSPKERAAVIPQQAALDLQQGILDVQQKMLDLQNEVAKWKREQAEADDKKTAKRRAWDYALQFLLALLAAVVALIAARLLPWFWN